jgi:hypothetical protein
MNKEHVLIDTALSGDRHLIKNKSEKILKYRPYKKIQLMRKVKSKVIPITGSISTSFGNI